VLKTDKHEKLTIINRDEYIKLGIEKCKEDREVNREEHKYIERRINDHTRFWSKILNSGINHDQQDRVLKSKLCHSENAAPKYFLYKDHKAEGGYRPVVSGCNSDTLGLSNTLSEVVESVANAVRNPFEVISSEDLLSRVSDCNEKLKEKRKEKENVEDWDWTSEFILLGSDVKSLFPSLSAKYSGIAVREQFEKSEITWQNIDWKEITLYVRLNENYWKENELEKVEKYLPKRITVVGRPPSIGTIGVESRFRWPNYDMEFLPRQIKKLLMGLAMEVAVAFIFQNFVYTFGGRKYLQLHGGPIGARITMAVARLVMQNWKDEFNIILQNSGIEELLHGLYVDDGRALHRKLRYGERYNHNERKFTVDIETERLDKENEIELNELTRVEVLKAMNAVSNDLEFTMELCEDFPDLKLPTLSFSLYADRNGLSHTYFEKAMRNQTLIMNRSAIGKQQLMNILSNELIRRMEVISDELEQNEKNIIVEKFTQQLVNSEYTWRTIREIVVSGLKGYKRKERNRIQNGIPKFRSGAYSLQKRTSKKLLEKYNWFRQRKQKLESEVENETRSENASKENKIRWQHFKKKKPPAECIDRKRSN